MSLLVVVRLQVRPERLSDVLSLIRTEFARPQGNGPGRRRGHVFQRLSNSTELLGCIEWDSQAAYEQYRRSPTHQAILDGLAGPTHAQYCTRLASFERMLERSEVATCAIITSAPAAAAPVEQHIGQEGRTQIIASPGLVSREVLRTLKAPPQYVVIHRWRQLADLERFRQATSRDLEQRLAELGATLERFTGALAAEYPVDSGSRG